MSTLALVLSFSPLPHKVLKMVVKELKKILARLPDDMPVGVGVITDEVAGRMSVQAEKTLKEKGPDGEFKIAGEAHPILFTTDWPGPLVLYIRVTEEE